LLNNADSLYGYNRIHHQCTSRRTPRQKLAFLSSLTQDWRQSETIVLLKICQYKRSYNSRSLPYFHSRFYFVTSWYWMAFKDMEVSFLNLVRYKISEVSWEERRKQLKQSFISIPAKNQNGPHSSKTENY
jgi:hypothetical protein